VTVPAGVLGYRRYRYLWLALFLAAAALGLYVSQLPGGAQPPNGGTWQGYTLGVAGAVLILWLSLLGIRKRRYRSRVGTVQGWTSAHVYLGLCLLLVATLHCALQFGLNVHTLAYALLVVVVLSGIYGIYAYATLPARVSGNAGGRDAEVWLEELADLDSAVLRASARGDAALQAMVASAIELTRLGGGTWATLRGADRSRLRTGDGGTVDNRDQQAIIDHLARSVPDASRIREAELLGELLDAFGRRQVLLRHLREDARLAALLRIWLFLHVPLTAALLAALLVHVITVFLYW
jgi:hypothetical protein